MAFREVATSKMFYSYPKTEPNTVLLEGWFIGTTQGKFGLEHTFVDRDQKYHVLNSAGHLNYQLRLRAAGDFCRITFLGKTRLTRGSMSGKDCNQFKVEVDDELKQFLNPGEPPRPVSHLEGGNFKEVAPIQLASSPSDPSMDEILS